MSTDKRKAKLLKLQERYAQELPGKVKEIFVTWEKLLADCDNAQLWELMIRQPHSLAGSGTTFGYPDITRIARELEELVKSSQQGSQPKGFASKVQALIVELDAASRLKPQEATLAPSSIQNQSKQSGRHAQSSIYLLDQTEASDPALTKQLSFYGYELITFADSKSLRQAIQTQLPCCFIVKIAGDYKRSFDQVKQLKEISDNSIPLIVIAKESTTELRLLAVRTGANAFFDEPFRTIRLIDSLDRLTEKGEHNPYRILIVDDSEATADYYSLSLQNAGMETEVVTKPLDIMRHMVEFEPDLILMDLYMPECSGGELSELIRQQEGYVGTPIVFLSAESNPEAQIEAMSYGADEFLTKPVRVRHLVAVVKIRVQRFRQVKSLIVRDSLTGLYNHTHTKELLERETNLSNRNGKPLQFAMIDIDHFKLVNDNYGHPVGDSVIKILARLLKQSLRSTDIIGRYGGEEFAVILPDTNEKEAEIILNKIRQDFSEIVLTSEHGDVKCTFSAGIAGYPSLKNSANITQSADDALYFSKRNGRNQVSLSQQETALSTGTE